MATILRATFFVVTQLPPPCNGFPNCKCSLRSYETVRRDHSLLQIAVIYIISFGFGTARVPSCGDTMMSANVVLQCCLGFYLIETMELLVTPDKINAVKFTVFMLILTSSLYSVFIRSEYTIGVVLSVVVVFLECMIYGIGQKMYDASYGPFVTTAFGRLFTKLEDDIEQPDDDAPAA
jgi:hypothetical protein